MKIIFKKLTIKNFMSIGNNPVVIDFTKAKKTLLIGGNGCGKTTIPTALTYALFGRAYSKVNLPSLVNSINGKDSLVTLEFEIGSTQYKIERGQKPKVFSIYKDGVLIRQDSMTKDYQEYLEESILKWNFNSFSQIVFLGSAGYVPFLQLKAADRRTFTEYMLSIAVFSVMNKVLKSKISESSNKIFQYEATKSSTEKSIRVYEEVIAESNKNRDAIIEGYNKKLADKAQEYKDQQAIVEKLKEEDSVLIHDSDLLTGIQINIKKCNSFLANKNGEMNEIRKKIKKISDGSVCNECMQPINDEHREKHLKQYNTELDTNGDIIRKVQAKLAEYESQESTLLDIKTRKDALAVKIQAESSKLNWIRSEAKSIHAEKVKFEDAQNNSVNVDKANALEQERKTLESIEESLNSELTVKRVRDIMLTSLKDTGAKAEIVKQYIPIIASLVNQYMQKLGIFVKFELDENFNETLKSRHRDEFSYESFSMGERTRINIALLFAWRDIIKSRTGISTNVLFFDEILEVLDMEGFDVLLSIIDQEVGTNCFVISHKTGLDQLFDDIIEVKKVKGFTELNQIK